jgi:UDP-N-acetylmuramyl pentapeptide phosphotransferase/UDP-N-acetylglucosamine-1-phosphate transferase
MITRMRRSAAFVVAAGLARVSTAGLRAGAPGGRDRWERRNYAGRTVELYAGPACAVAAALGTARVRPAAGFAVLAAGVCGAYDDVAGAGDSRRGFRAHLSALRDGEVTSGAVKLFGISAAGLVAGALLKERAVDKVLAGVVIAGAAHFVNLVDVRPGRAAAAVVVFGVPGLLRKGAGAELAAAAVGTAVAVLPDDVGERAMIGDTGAHALGAALGAAVVAGNGRAGLFAHAAALVAATVYGDKVSEAARSVGAVHGSRAV